MTSWHHDIMSYVRNLWTSAKPRSLFENHHFTSHRTPCYRRQHDIMTSWHHVIMSSWHHVIMTSCHRVIMTTYWWHTSIIFGPLQSRVLSLKIVILCHIVTYVVMKYHLLSVILRKYFHCIPLQSGARSAEKIWIYHWFSWFFVWNSLCRENSIPATRKSLCR